MSPTAVALGNEHVEIGSLIAEEAIAKGLAIKAGVAAKSCVICGAGDKALGISNNVTLTGEAVSYAKAKPLSVFAGALAGAAIAAVDTDLTPDANGKLIASTTGDNVIGQNIFPVPALDDVVSVRFEDGNRVTP